MNGVKDVNEYLIMIFFSFDYSDVFSYFLHCASYVCGKKDNGSYCYGSVVLAVVLVIRQIAMIILS